MSHHKGKAPRLSQTEYLIMRMLVKSGSGEMYGLEMVEASEKRLKRGTVYVLLSRLEDKGYVKSRTEPSESAIPRRMYKVTGLGQQIYKVWSQLAQLGGLSAAAT